MQIFGLFLHTTYKNIAPLTIILNIKKNSIGERELYHYVLIVRLLAYCKVAGSNLTCMDDWKNKMAATLSGPNFNETIFAGSKYHSLTSS